MPVEGGTTQSDQVLVFSLSGKIISRAIFLAALISAPVIVTI